MDSTTLTMAATNMKKPLSRVESRAVTPPTTPTPISASAHQILSQIRCIYQELSSLSSLEPCEQINSLLMHLVNLCITPYSQEFSDCFFNIDGAGALCQSLRPLCANAEGELERYWANRILHASTNIQATPSEAKNLLKTFPYYTNYLDLSRLEVSLLTAFLPPSSPAPRNIAFIGSGPLPLTSFCLLDTFPTSKIHNIDRDATALSTSRNLTQALGYAHRMMFSCEDIISPATNTAYQDLDVVFLAALVGMDSAEKLRMLRGLAGRLKPGTLIVARSARGLRSVLYPVLGLGEVGEESGCEVLVEVHPWGSVVNSVVVLRVVGR